MTPARQPAGIPAGGQFAGGAQARAAVALPPTTYFEPGATVMYHCVAPDARDAIAEHGLDWTKGPRADQPIVGWNDDGEEIELPRANYLYVSAASAWERAAGTGECIYEVDVTGLDMHRDPYEDSEAMMSIEPIEPARLRESR